MIPQNRISHTDVTRDALVKAPIGKDAKRRGEMLLPIQTLLLEGVELRVRADPQLLAGLCFAQGLHAPVLGGIRIVDVECWCHCCCCLVEGGESGARNVQDLD